MINTTIPQKMRQIAGYIYGALFVFELFTLYYFINAYSVTEMPLGMLLEMFVMGLAAVACVLCIAGRNTLSDTAVRAGIIVTGVVVLFELFTIRLQVNMIASSISVMLSSTLPSGTAQMSHYMLFAVRLVLMILAAFFLTSARGGTQSDDMYEEEEGVFDVESTESEEELEEKTEEIKESVEKAEDEAKSVDEEAEEGAPEDKKDEE